MIDEDASTLDDSMFVMDMKSAGGWVDLPARRHADAYALNFADGHAATFRLTSGLALQGTKSMAVDEDWAALRNVTTIRK